MCAMGARTLGRPSGGSIAEVAKKGPLYTETNEQQRTTDDESNAI